MADWSSTSTSTLCSASSRGQIGSLDRAEDEASLGLHGRQTASRVLMNADELAQGDTGAAYRQITRLSDDLSAHKSYQRQVTTTTDSVDEPVHHDQQSLLVGSRPASG